MRRFPFIQVDAFTSRVLAGNPCAIVFDADDLDERLMQAIARENNLSETSFVSASDSADFRVRYFTPVEEVPMAGHPTIATAWALVETGRVALAGPTTTITLEMNVGLIEVDLAANGGTVDQITMAQKKPLFLKEFNPAEVMPVIGLSPDEAVHGVPIQTVSTGTPQLMIPLRDLDALRRARFNEERFERIRPVSDFFSIHLFCVGGMTGAGDTAARHFTLPPESFEDPFTGSATGGMGAYLWRYGLIESSTFVAEQGHWMERPGRAAVEAVGPRDAIESVRVGGVARTIIRGELELPDDGEPV